MKYLSIPLALVCIVLAILFYNTKQTDTAQHASDADSIAQFSNQLVSVQAQVVNRDGTIFTLTNSLNESQAAAVAFSNHLTDAQATVGLEADQITNLTRQVAGFEADNQSLTRRIIGLTNQIAGLTQRTNALSQQLALTETNLAQAGRDYVLLENRFRVDVGERVVAERKFNNLPQLKARIKQLKDNPGEAVSAESIYAGLDVEVKSNSFHVIAPN